MIKIKIFKSEPVHVDYPIKPESHLGKGVIMISTLFFKMLLPNLLTCVTSSLPIPPCPPLKYHFVT